MFYLDGQAMVAAIDSATIPTIQVYNIVDVS